ncbi:ComEA family DNA-binding protein, partial [Planctomycetota bacterium]
HNTFWLILVLLTIFFGIRYYSNKSYVGIQEVEDKEKVKEIERKINPNTASWTSMARLPGIGEKLAQAIVDYRKVYWSENVKTQCFNRCEDLENVRGIGPVKREQIRPYLKYDVKRN